MIDVNIRVGMSDKVNTTVKCPLADVCGACDLQGRSYAEQLKIKQERIEKLFSKIVRVSPIIGSPEHLFYRNKVQVSFGKDEKGKTVVGNYVKDSHYLVPIDECMICDEKIIDIIRSIRTIVNRHHLSVYDERAGRGTMRHVLVRSTSRGEYMVVLVTSSPHIKDEKEVVKDIVRYNPSIRSIIHNINMAHTSMILGEKSRLLYGKAYITDKLLGHEFRISASSFYQINRFQTENLYRKAVEYASLSRDETLIDAYCGTGTMGIIMSSAAREVIGVELNKDAVRDANENKRANRVKNISFIEDDAGRFMRRLSSAKRKIDVVVMDPPRSGSDEAFLRSLCILRPQRVVYVSCNPDTLLRDVLYLRKQGYELKKLQPVDMFPYTEHCETVVLLSKGEVDSKKIRVEFSLEDMDMSEFQDGATYTQIKDYVLEHSGLKVSNLYISQIKRKCGIEVGKNYNLPKSEDSRQPLCPPEKEKAIREAFKYFGII